MDGLKKLDCNEEYGVWYYKVCTSKDSKYIDDDAYILYDENKKAVANFTSLTELKNYVTSEASE